MNKMNYLQYSGASCEPEIITFPKDYEYIYIFGEDIFNNNIKIRTTLNEIKSTRMILEKMNKRNQLELYIKLDDELTSEYKRPFKIDDDYYIKIIQYILLKEILYNKHIIRILSYFEK